jgi:hypothetical protein
MTNHGVEVITVDSKPSVSFIERATVVIRRSAEHLRHQQSLVTLEPRHVDALEVRRKLRVAENPLVKVVYHSTYSRPTANGVVVADGPASRLFSHGLLVLSAKSERSRLLTMSGTPGKSERLVIHLERTTL